MTDPGEGADAGTTDGTDMPRPATPAWDDVFGDVLPELTGNERPGAAGRRNDEAESDERLRREVPPHH